MTPPAMDGSTFRELRDRAGLSQTQLAARFGWPQAYISRIERGVYSIEPRLAEYMRRLADNPGRRAPSLSTPQRPVAAPARTAMPGTLCGRCGCVSDQFIPCGCPGWVG